jgi:uncharacterized protein involved in response to NO
MIPLRPVAAPAPAGTAAPWRLARLLSAPHRLGFGAGALWLALSALWWLAVLAAPRLGIDLPWAVAPTQAHGLLLGLSFMPFFMVGFLFTAGPRWLGVDGPEVPALLAPVLVQLASWMLVLGGVHLGADLAALGLSLAALGWGLLLARFIGLVRRSSAPDRLHARAVAAAGATGLVAMGLVALALLQRDAASLHVGLMLALWGFVAPVFAIVSHRMIPFFSAAALPGLEAWRPNSLLALMLGALTAAGALELGLGLPAVLRAGLVAALALAGLALLALAIRWGLVRSLGGSGLRLLAMLHGGFVWLGIALLLEAASVGLQLAGHAGLGVAPLHALTVGYLGATLIAMATRVISGHSGRPLAVDGWAWMLYLLLQVAVLLRLAAALGAPVLLLAALSWAAVAAAWALRYGRWLGQPRVDGRPG